VPECNIRRSVTGSYTVKLRQIGGRADWLDLRSLAWQQFRRLRRTRTRQRVHVFRHRLTGLTPGPAALGRIIVSVPDRSPDSRLAVVCHSCGYPSSAYIAGKITGEDDDGLFELSLIRCEHCDAASVVRQDEAGEAFPVEVWPRGPRTLDEQIPAGIRQSVTEARNCFGAGSYLATAVLVRRSIEGLCADQGANHKTLHRALQDLVGREVIDARLLEWADGLRVLGNIGAHFTKQSVSKQDASDAIDLIEALLDYVYVFTAKFEEFKTRRDSPDR